MALSENVRGLFAAGKRRKRRISVVCTALVLTAAGVLTHACVQHPTRDVSDEVASDAPWEVGVTISGALAVPSGLVEIEVATDKDATEFEPLATTESDDTAVDSPGFPEYFPWERPNTIIPQQYWFRGVSGGFIAHLRAFSELDGERFQLGTPEHVNTPQVCWAFEQNPNAFAEVAALLEGACEETPTATELTFAFRTPDFNDHCGRLTEACCSVGAPCDAGLQCGENNRCTTIPPTPPDPGQPPGDPGGTNDDQKCESDAIEVVSGFRPSNCQVGFAVNGFRRCVNGKFSEPTAERCNGSSSGPPPGTECYCDIMGGPCGQGVGSLCGNPPNNDLPCVPGGACFPPNYSQTPGPVPQQYVCVRNGPTPQCWKLDDVKRTDFTQQPPRPGSGGMGGMGGMGGGGRGGG